MAYGLKQSLKGSTMAASLLDIVHEIGRLEERVRAFGDTDQADTKHELIRLRREFAQLIGTIGAAAEADPVLTADPQLAKEFRQRLSKVRTATALHQSNWPAVSSARADPAYRASADRVTAENLSFVAWIKGALGSLR